jgi:hypothetical protein
LDSNAFITYNVPNPSLVSFGTLYPFGSANTITYLSGLGFKTMPFALTGSNSIKYVISRNTSTNLYYMTLFAENTCTLTTNTTLSSVSFICCGNGGTAGWCSGASPSFGAGGGGIGTGLLGYAIGSGTVISITRANGSNTILVIGPFTEATATAGGNSTTSAAGATGTATTAGYTSYNGGAGGSGSGVNGSNAGSTSITINSGYNLTSTGFGGGGRAGNGTTSNGGGGSYGFGGTGTSRAGLGYGAGAGGQIGNATPASQAGNPGVVILSFLI